MDDLCHRIETVHRFHVPQHAVYRDLSMLCQQTVLYFGTRLAVFLFLSVSISAAGDRLYA